MSHGKTILPANTSSPPPEALTPKIFLGRNSFSENSMGGGQQSSQQEISDNECSGSGSDTESSRTENESDESDSDEDSEISDSEPISKPKISTNISLSLPTHFQNQDIFSPKKLGSARPLGLTLSLANLAEKIGPIDAANEEELYSKKTRIATYDKICSEITSQLFLGSDTIAKDLDILQKCGITHILNCAGSICPMYFPDQFNYKVLYLVDGNAEDVSCLFYEVIDYIDNAIENGGKVFVHCQQGVSRSSTMLICYLMWKTDKPFSSVHSYVKLRRNISNPNPGFIFRLLDWWNKTHPSQSHPSRNRLYRILPHNINTPTLVALKEESKVSAEYLDPRGVFILQAQDKFFVWIGEDCLRPKFLVANAQRLITRMKKCHLKLQPLPVFLVKQNEETDEFWETLAVDDVKASKQWKYLKLTDRDPEYELIELIPESLEA